MTLFPKPMNIQELHKTLPKKYSHIKEEAKVKFIKEAIRLYKTNKTFGIIDFDNSVFDGKNVVIKYQSTNERIHLEKLVHDILEKWYFSNLEKNENVYFYRFVNLFRAEFTDTEWIYVDKYLKTSNNIVLKENYKQYSSYRDKLDEIEFIISQDTFFAKEM